MSDAVLDTLKQTIIAQIGATLNVQDKLVQEVVSQVINKKVDKVSGTDSGYNEKIPYLEWIVKHTLSDCVRQAVHDWVREKSVDIQQQIKGLLEDNTSEIAQSIASNALKAMSAEYSVRCEVNLAKKSICDNCGDKL